MTVVAGVLVGLVALLHGAFLVLEMFLWKTPFGRRTFRTTPEVAESSATLAANQGLYNGFLAAGLVWGLILGIQEGRAVLTFFLSCVVLAGLFGAATASKRILFVQALPAALALLLVWLPART
jgi:putative membrane protein